MTWSTEVNTSPGWNLFWKSNMHLCTIRSKFVMDLGPLCLFHLDFEGIVTRQDKTMMTVDKLLRGPGREKLICC